MSSDEARSLFERLKKEAEAGGYLLNPDEDFVLDLMEGLVTNQQRYGYLACPCRLADGNREDDLRIQPGALARQPCSCRRTRIGSGEIAAGTRGVAGCRANRSLWRDSPHTTL